MQCWIIEQLSSNLESNSTIYFECLVIKTFMMYFSKNFDPTTLTTAEGENCAYSPTLNFGSIFLPQKLNSFICFVFFVFMRPLGTLEPTVVGLSTRPSPLIISKFLQFRTFWSQSRAFFMIRCTLTIGSWLKTFRVQKWPYWVQNFEFLLHKITNFRGISGWQWTMPNG